LFSKSLIGLYFNSKEATYIRTVTLCKLLFIFSCILLTKSHSQAFDTLFQKSRVILNIKFRPTHTNQEFYKFLTVIKICLLLQILFYLYFLSVHKNMFYVMFEINYVLHLNLSPCLTTFSLDLLNTFPQRTSQTFWCFPPLLRQRPAGFLHILWCRPCDTATVTDFVLAR